MSTNHLIVEKLTEAQIIQLLEMYQNECWSKGRKLDDVSRILNNSNIVALINRNNDEIIGFARFLSDGVYRAIMRFTCNRNRFDKRQH